MSAPRSRGGLRAHSPPSDIDEPQRDKRLERASRLCTFFSLHTLLKCESLEKHGQCEAEARMLELLTDFRGFREDTLKSALLTKVLVKLVDPQLQSRDARSSRDESLLVLIGKMLL